MVEGDKKFDISDKLSMMEALILKLVIYGKLFMNYRTKILSYL